MKRSLRRIVSLLCVLALCIGLLPATALATGGVTDVTGDGVYSGVGTVAFRVYTTQLYKLLKLADPTITADTDIDDVALLLYEEYLSSNEISLEPMGVTKLESDYWHCSISNAGGKADPSNIRGLKIAYEGKTVTIAPEELRLSSDIVSGNGFATYTVSSNNDETHIVAFYDSGDTGTGSTGAFSLYHVSLVANGETVASEDWPKNPEYISYRFGNWGTEETGGTQFTIQSPVTSDTVVYAQKLSGVDVHAGTQIHVMNTGNALLKRYVELYNAQHGTDIDVANIDLNSVKITVNGENGSTNPNYYVSSVEHNGWKEDGYYLVYNRNGDVVDPGSPLHNTHIPYNEILSITITAKVGNSQDPQSVTINRGINSGEFSTTTEGLDRIFVFNIIPAPAKPDADDLTILASGAVKVDCVSPADHDDKPYGLLEGSYSVGEVTWTGTADEGYYTSAVTVNSEKYVAQYNTDDGVDVTHTLKDGESDPATITLKWTGSTWIADSAQPVTFQVSCGDEPVPPAEVAYTVEYYYDGVRNYDYTYNGTGEAGDIISQYPPRSVAGYAVDYTVGLPLTLAVGGANTIKVYYAKDANGDEIPDNKQVFIKYVSSDPRLGTVYPTEQVKTFWDGVAKDITLDSTATPKDNAEFVSWTDETSSPISDSAAIKYTLKFPELGETYTFTANFKEKEPVPPAEVAYTVQYYYDNEFDAGKNVTGSGTVGAKITTVPDKAGTGYCLDHDNLPFTLTETEADNVITVYYATDKIGGTDPTDPGYPGDGIPDKYQVTIYYTASTGGYITGRTSEVLTIYNGTSYAAVGTVTATGSSAASHWDYSFVNWTNNAGAPVFYTYAFGPVAISNAAGGQTYTFTANFTWSWYPVNPPVIPNPPVDNGPEDLNTEEHVAYIVGFEDGTIRPEANITRAEVATIFFRLLTSEARAQYWSQTNAFTDVSSGDWYNNAVSTLANMGILGGYSDGTFRPSQPITRSEFVKIAVSFFKYADSYAYDGRFTDVEGDEWYVSFLAAAVNFGLIEGMPDGTFQPEAYISRAEACTIVNRTLGRAPHKDYLLPLADMLTWPDNTNRNAWYYEAMQEATNSHDYTWITVNGEKVESWTAKLAERNWAALEQQWSNAYSAAGSEVIK